MVLSVGKAFFLPHWIKRQDLTSDHKYIYWNGAGCVPYEFPQYHGIEMSVEEFIAEMYEDHKKMLVDMDPEIIEGRRKYVARIHAGYSKPPEGSREAIRAMLNPTMSRNNAIMSLDKCAQEIRVSDLLDPKDKRIQDELMDRCIARLSLVLLEMKMLRK